MIRFDHVTKRYSSNVGLEDVSIDIEKGEFVFLVGPSGAGKSTFIKLIMKEIEADEGSIQVMGQEVVNLSSRKLPQHRRNIGMIFQDFRLLPNKTVFENVAFAMEIVHKSNRQIRKQVPRALSLMGISSKANMFPDELSAGEQQRVAIARAILKDAPILILDEATSALDNEVEAEVSQGINNLIQGKTVIAVAHRLSTLKAMDRIVVLDKGKIIEEGTPDSLIKKGGKYAKLWKLQTS